MKSKKHFFVRHMLFSTLFPSFVSAIFLAVADIADAFVVGNRLGEIGLAAIGLVTPVYMFYNVLGYGLAIGGEIIHTRLVASGKEEEAIEHFNLLLWTGIVGAVVLAALGLIFRPQMLGLLGAGREGDELFGFCSQYYIPLIAAAPLFLANYIFYDLLRCDNDPHFASFAFVMGCAADVGFNLLFVLVLKGGVTGSILATITGQCVTAFISFFHFQRKRGILRFRKPVISFRRIFPAFRIGVSSSVRYLFQLVFLTVANNLLIRYAPDGDGSLYVAVFDLVMNVSYVAYALYEGTGAAVRPLASAFFTEKDAVSLSYVRKLGWIWGMLCGTAVAGVIAFFAGNVAKVFGVTHPEAQAIAVQAIRIFCVSAPIAGFLLMEINFFQAVGKERLTSLLTLLRGFMVLLPLTVLLGRFRAEDFWWLFPATEAISLIIGYGIIWITRANHIGMDLPVLSVTLENSNHEISELLAATERFCDENAAAPKQANLLSMAVEEICMATIQQAFTGDEHEYIQVTVVAEEGGRFTLVIRNSARSFNPFDMKTGKISTREEDEAFLDSVGILVIRKQAQNFFYRRNANFNIVTMEI